MTLVIALTVMLPIWFFSAKASEKPCRTDAHEGNAIPGEILGLQTLVVRNTNGMLREWDGSKDTDKIIPLGPKSGAEKSLFGDACAVIVFNDGTGEIIPAKELTYARLYRRAFKGPPLFGYLTVRGYVEPK